MKKELSLTLTSSYSRRAAPITRGGFAKPAHAILKCQGRVKKVQNVGWIKGKTEYSLGIKKEVEE